MTDKDPDDDLFDLSSLPDLEGLDLSEDADEGGDDLLGAFGDLEPLTQASAESPEAPPEVPVEPTSSAPPAKPVEAAQPAVPAISPKEALPDLPDEAEIVPVKPKAAPRPAPKPAPRPAAKATATARPAKPAAPTKPVAPAKPVAKAKPAVPVEPAAKGKAATPAKPVVPPVERKVAAAPVVPRKKAVPPEKKEEPAQQEAQLEPVAAVASEVTEEVKPEVTTEGGVTFRAEPDVAPLHLRKAAWIVAFGSVVPWMGSGGGWVSMGASKALVVLGAWLLYQTVEHKAGNKVPGFVAKLAGIRFVQDSGKRKKNIAEQILLLIPTPAHVLGLAVLLFGAFSASLDPVFANGAGFPLKALAEVGMLAWAAGTIVHIDAYVHGGKFNPIFPLMFIAMALAGIIGALNAVLMFSAEGANPGLAAVGLAGSAVVAAGGLFACYTVFEAMKAAKVHGEAKKAAAREARKVARQQKTGQG